MNREMLEMVEVLAQEKNVPREVVFGVLETALASAVKKANFAGEDADIEVHVDRETGDYQARKCTLISMMSIRNSMSATTSARKFKTSTVPAVVLLRTPSK